MELSLQIAVGPAGGNIITMLDRELWQEVIFMYNKRLQVTSYNKLQQATISYNKLQQATQVLICYKAFQEVVRINLRE